MKQQERFIDPETSRGGLLWLIAVGSDIVRPFVASGQGAYSYGKPALVVFLGLPVVSGLAHAPEIFLFWKFLWVPAVILRMLFPDRRQTSTYVGNPWLASMLTLWLLPDWLNRKLEFLLVFGVARLVQERSIPLSRMLMFAAFSLAATEAIYGARDRRRQVAMEDAAKMARG